MSLKRISAAEIFNQNQESQSFDLLDLRPISEFMAGFIPFSMSLPESESNFLINLRKIWASPRDVVVVTIHSVIPEQIQSAIKAVGGTLIGYLDYHEWTQAGYLTLTLEGIEFDELGRHSHVLIDVRTPSEWASKQIPMSQNAPLSDLEDIAQSLNRSQNYVAFCAGVYRGLNGAAKMRSEGLNVRYFANGLNTWYDNITRT